MTALTKETKLTLLYILIAFTFSVLMRMIWIYQFTGYEAFMHNGQFMINTNDGYYWAEGARDLISGVTQANDRSPIETAASQITAFFAHILPFSFETVILYLPVFLSSLLVIPMVLIAKNLKNLEMGLIASLLASIAWSYYNRTMVGYYDTDMLNIVIPMFLLWSIIVGIRTHESKYLLVMALSILVYDWWYQSSYSLEVSFFAMVLLYTLILDRKNTYNYKFMSMMLLSMAIPENYFGLGLLIAIFFLLKGKKVEKYIYYIFGLSVVLFLVAGGFEPIFNRLKIYIFKDSIMSAKEGLGLHFYSVMQTVREAGQIPFETFANRISGHPVTFVISILGYLYLSYRHKIMLFALPMVGLGFLASVGGLRFTIYAVPILAFGIAFLITEISSQMPTKKLKYLTIIMLTLGVLYPNYKHIDGYKVPTVFNADEVKILENLHKVANREDYVIAWWDYGYPIRYYADVKTLTDGGKHEGDSNFPVSFILTNPQEQAAKMARLDVEYTEERFESNRTLSNIENMSLDYGFSDTNDFLFSLQTDIKLPQKTRDIYFYLPFKMLNIYPTVKVFSNMDLMSGEKAKQPFFFISRNFKDLGDKIALGKSVFMNKKDSTLSIGSNKVPIKRFVKTYYLKNGELKKDVQVINPSATLSVIYMSNYNTFLVLDEETYNSLYIQLMVLEEYDKSLFEKVIASPHAKVYKLKI